MTLTNRESSMQSLDLEEDMIETPASSSSSSMQESIWTRMSQTLSKSNHTLQSPFNHVDNSVHQPGTRWKATWQNSSVSTNRNTNGPSTNIATNNTWYCIFILLKKQLCVTRNCSIASDWMRKKSRKRQRRYDPRFSKCSFSGVVFLGSCDACVGRADDASCVNRFLKSRTTPLVHLTKVQAR
mgnify:CR=1 FL=1